MTVILGDGSDALRLWQAQETKRNVQGNVQVDSVFSTDSDDTLLTGMEAQEQVVYTGLTTGNRLSNQSNYSDDRVEALAEWVADLETFVNGTQGTGWPLYDSDRERTIHGVVAGVGWQRSRAALYEVEWNIELIRGEGIMAQRAASPEAVSPQTRATLDRMDLGDLQQTQMEKQQPFEVYHEAFAEPGSNPIKSQGGAVRTFTLSGRIAGEAARNEFDGHVRSLVGSDTIVPYESAFPGRTTPVMVRDFESTRESGQTRLGEYSIEVVEGRADFTGG